MMASLSSKVLSSSRKRLRDEDMSSKDDKLIMEESCWKCKGKGYKFVKKTKKFEGDSCGVCHGSGKRKQSNRSNSLAQQPGKIVKLRGLPEGSDNPGGHIGVPAKGDVSSTRVNRGEILASLGCGNWRIFQLANGHKLTVDDFVCAWVAAEEMRSAGLGPKSGAFGSTGTSSSAQKKFQHVDIGCGCGSVLMTLAWAFPNLIISHGVEAQKVSFDLCQRGLEFNLGKYHAAYLKNQDLRSWRPEDNRQRFDLVTGTPPYFPSERFVSSENHSQKVRCRVPTRGAASDYVEAAARLLAKGGVFVMVETARKEAEIAVMQAADTHCLRVKKRIDIVTRTGLPPRFSCWVMISQQHNIESGRSSDFPITKFTLRNENKKRSMEYVEAMEVMGWIDFENTRQLFHSIPSKHTSEAQQS
jgi:tRNA1(Val) A37 N6-methylase TrmN6